MKRLENYRQNVEAELIAMIAALIGLGVFALGATWAAVLMVEWFLC